MPYQDVLANDMLLARYDAAGDSHYYHHDGLGSIMGMTDEGKSVEQSYFYDEFGNSLGSWGNVSNHYPYTGQEYDGSITQLYNLRARYYKSSIGRFTSEDPVMSSCRKYRRTSEIKYSIPQELNQFSYVQNNAVNFVDPLGSFRYKKGTQPAGRWVEAMLGCMDFCLRRNLGISAGTEPSGHVLGSMHYAGEAADVSFRMNPGLESGEVMCCAKKCGFGFALIEADHYHLQGPPGRGGSRGDLPECGCEPYAFWPIGGFWKWYPAHLYP